MLISTQNPVILCRAQTEKFNNANNSTLNHYDN